MINLEDINIEDFVPQKCVLTNALPLYIFANNDMEVTYVKFVFYNAGTISQKKFFTASLTKTLLAQDTENFSSQSLNDQIDYYGIGISASTSNERTTITFSFLKKYAHEAISLMEEVILRAVFKPEKLQSSIALARQEFLTRLQQTSFIAHREFMANLFGKDNPYGKYAQVEDYDKVNEEDLKEFYHRCYALNECYVIVSGSVEENFLRDFENSFGKKLFNKEKTIFYEEKTLSYPEPSICTVSVRGAVQASIAMGRILPNIHSEDYVGLTILNCILGGYFNSRLMSNIREKKGYTYGINSFIEPYRYGAVLMIAGDIVHDKDKDTLSEISKEIIRLQDEVVPEEELTMVKRYIIGQILQSIDGVNEIGDAYDQIVRFSLCDDYTSRSVDKMKLIAPKDVRDLAKKYLNKDNFTIVVAK